jgi:hypothetical protein
MKSLYEKAGEPCALKGASTVRRGRTEKDWPRNRFIGLGSRSKQKTAPRRPPTLYLYRAIDRDGNLVDLLLSEKRDMQAAKRFDLRKLSLWLVTRQSE